MQRMDEETTRDEVDGTLMVKNLPLGERGDMYTFTRVVAYMLNDILLKQ